MNTIVNRVLPDGTIEKGWAHFTDEWMDDYNNKRPHESLGNKTPSQVKEEYLASLTTAQAKVAS